MAASVSVSPVLAVRPIAPRLYRADPSAGPAGRKISSRLPSQWILDGGLRSFRDQPAFIGRSAAALKLFLTVAVMAEDAPDALAGEHQGTALLSYDDLGRLAGLSRPLIAQARNLLCAQNLLRFSQEGRGRQVRYRLERFSRRECWTRIPLHAAPADHATESIEPLHRLSCRRLDDLHALKLYVLLCALSDPSHMGVAAEIRHLSHCTNLSNLKIELAARRLMSDGLISLGQEGAHHPDGWLICRL